MHLKLSVFTLLLTVAGMSLANPLNDRNLPDGKLLYEDAKNVYYGLYTTSYLTDPTLGGANPSDVVFRVFLFRVPEKDGSLIKLIPVPLVEDNFGRKGPGYKYDSAEQNIINEHVMKKVDNLFPKRKHKNFLMLYIYARDRYFSNGKSAPDLGSENPDVKDPEREVAIMNFARKSSNEPMLPGYVAKNVPGVLASMLSSRGLQDLYPARIELSKEIVAQRHQHQASVNTRYFSEMPGSMKKSGINNPHGMYLVGASFVGRVVQFRRRDEDGSYAIDAYDIKDGSKLLDGWWYPQHQQIWAMEKTVLPAVKHCNRMSKFRWSYEFVPGKRKVNGASITLYEEAGHFSGTREPKICEVVRINKNTCQEFFCVKYAKNSRRFFLVDTEIEAKNLQADLK